MRAARNVAAAFTVVCLFVAAVSLLSSTSLTFCAGSDCTSVDCGSPAFPKELIDFDSPDDAANCAGVPSASVGLYGVLLAALGLAVVVLTARAGKQPPSSEGLTGEVPGGGVERVP